MIKKIKNNLIKKGRAIEQERLIAKFEILWDEYYGQGDLQAADFVTDILAYLNDDTEGMSDEFQSDIQ